MTALILASLVVSSIAVCHLRFTSGEDASALPLESFFGGFILLIFGEDLMQWRQVTAFSLLENVIQVYVITLMLNVA